MKSKEQVNSEIRNQVKKLLKMYPELRSNDQQLIATYWFNEIGKEKVELLSAYDLIQLLANKQITHTESIRRHRQKIQAAHPELRSLKPL
jgi:hypothetical protein